MSPLAPRDGIDLERVEAIKQDVDLESLIDFNYAHLRQQIEPQLLRRYIRLPSPFRPPGDNSESFIIFEDKDDAKRAWHWADPMAPNHVPRDVIGFTMAFDQISYEDAVEKLWQLLPSVQKNKALADRHRDSMSSLPENHAISAETGHIRKRLATLGSLNLGQAIDSPPRQKRKYLR